jgi:hypothetical protein
MKDKKQAAEEYVTNHPYATIIGAFCAGAEWQKSKKPYDGTDLNISFEQGKLYERKQMMKEAVEGKIYGYDDGSFELIVSWLDMPKESKFKDGDKVRIIVVKAEEE